MVDPYPERRRRDRLDRTDHRREVESRRAGRRGPSQKQIDRALQQVADHDVPGTPHVGTLKVLQEIHETERMTDTRRVRDLSITRGDPQHGAYRSDDHVGRYVVALPFAEVDGDTFEGDTCPECGGDRAVYKYRAHHFIAGSESLFCARCETNHNSEEWS